MSTSANIEADELIVPAGGGCVMLLLMEGHFGSPLGIGSFELVTIDELVDIVEDIPEANPVRRYELSNPPCARGRSSGNSLVREQLAWEWATPLARGQEGTYRWIYDQLSADKRDAVADRT